MTSDEGDITVSDNAEQRRYELHYDGQLAGFVDYRRHGDRVELTHTEIDDAFGGKGLGSKLARGALDAVRASGGTVTPTCDFIRGYIDKHEEYADLVSAA